MADKKVEPLFKLPAEVQTRLKNAQTDIEKARAALEVMKSLGMDTKELESKLDWSEQVRTTLLKEFT